jgi:hypothetical protein
METFRVGVGCRGRSRDVKQGRNTCHCQERSACLRHELSSRDGSDEYENFASANTIEIP